MFGSNMYYKPAKSSKKGHRHQTPIKIEEYSLLDDHQYCEDDLYTTTFDDNDDKCATDHTVCLENYISHILTRHHKSSYKKDSRDYSATSQDDYHDKEIRKSTYSVQVSSVNNCEQCKHISKVVVIGDDQSAEQHRITHDLLKKRNMLLANITDDFCPHFPRSYSQRHINRLSRKRRELLAFEEKIGKNRDTEKKSKSKAKVPELTLENDNLYKSCQVKLVSNEIAISELKRIWRENYREGESLPRKFAINLSHHKSYLESACILIELDDKLGQITNHCHASIKLLLNHQLLKISEEIAQTIIQDFCVAMETCSGVISVKDVVDKAKLCIGKHTSALNRMNKISQSKNSASLEQIERVEGYKVMLYTDKEAFVEIKKEMCGAAKNEEDYLYCNNPCPVSECGICLEELIATDSCTYTMLRMCGHSFCNHCYQMYIHTKLINGQVDLVCPQHTCTVLIDPVTVMSLIPYLYSKYFSWKVQRHLLTSTSWKNCPSDQCNLIVKVTPARGKDSRPDPWQLPVSCHCNSIWCFSCQKQAHWPATCQQTQKFRANNTGYKTVKELTYITSVSVKNCPNCSYPIEKYLGCPAMYCVMCQTSFCWLCLTVFSTNYRHHCSKEEVGKRHVELDLFMSDKERYAAWAVQSYYTVKTGLSLKTHQRIKSLEQGLKTYQTLKKVSKKFHTSKMGLILDNMMKSGVTDVLRKAYNFKLQAHIAVEGMVICMVSDCRSNLYLEKFRILLYMLEKLADILDNPLGLHKAENVERVSELVGYGEKLLMKLK